MSPALAAAAITITTTTTARAPARRFPLRGLRLLLLLLLVAPAATACAPRSIAEAVLLLGNRYIRTENIAYGRNPQQRLDVYRPRGVGAGSPVVVFLHGGRWRNGSKNDYRTVANALTKQGFVVVIPDARLYPQSVFPGWVEDDAQAIRWTRDHVAAYGGDTARIVVVGHSAGAHTAVMLALDERYLAGAGVPPGAIAGFVSLAGPIDTVWTDPDVQQVMGPRERWPSSYPVTYLDGTEPPLLLLHGADDDVVIANGTTRFAERVRARGGCARARVYDDVGHVSIVVALAAPALRIAPVLDDVSAFVRRPVATACPAMPRR